MKTLSLLVLLFAISMNLKTQENYIIAGHVDSNLYYHDIIPDKKVTAFAWMGEGDTKYYYLDLNSDDINDFKFIVTDSGGQGGWTQAVYIEPLNQNSVSFSHDHMVLTDTTECGDTLYISVAKKYYDSDTIVYDSSFKKTSLVLNWDSWRYFCYDDKINEWVDSQYLYVGLSVEDSVGYTLGWTKVYSVGMSSITFDSYYYNKGVNLAIGENKYDAFNVYPNPAKNYINIKSMFSDRITNIEIFDLNGREYSVDTYFGATSSKINISKLTTGLYIIELYSRGKLYIYKFLKA